MNAWWHEVWVILQAEFADIGVSAGLGREALAIFSVMPKIVKMLERGPSLWPLLRRNDHRRHRLRRLFPRWRGGAGRVLLRHRCRLGRWNGRAVDVWIRRFGRDWNAHKFNLQWHMA